ncbi:MAG: sensor histidine kinase [Pseudomonadota bacterium]
MAIFCQIGFVQAQDRVLDISEPAEMETVGRVLDIYLDPDHTKTIEDMREQVRVQFTPIATKVADVGYTNAMVWLRLNVKNTASDNSDWRLYFNENFKQIFHIYVVSEDGTVEHVLAQERDSPFSTRPVAYPEIVAPMVLNKGESATVYVRYWTEGSTYLPLEIQSAAMFSETATRSAAKQSIFYGMMMILILAAFLASFVIWHPIFPAYIAYSGATLLFLMHVDGVAFQYLWPGFPNFNSYASVVTGGFYGVFGAIYARIFLNTKKHHPIIDKFLVGTVIVLLTMMVSGMVVDPSLIKRYMILVVLFSLGLFTLASILAARQRFKQVRFYLVAWLGATVSAFLMMLRHWFGIEISQEFQHDSMRTVMIFDAVMMGLAIVDRYSQVRQDRQNALHASLGQAQRNLDMSNRLRKLEARYDLALETNIKHKEHIENTVHDIRQPLHALRLAVLGIMNDKSPDAGNGYADISESFNYLEQLVAEQLHDSASAGVDTGISEMQLGDVLGSIHEMFLPDALEKGLSFDYVPTSLTTAIQPLTVMRIISNLVSNAIKYTPSGKLLLGVRRFGDALRIEVHDTGTGLSAEEFKLACQRGVRLEAGASPQEEGKGHGLDIVASLAKRNGYKVDLLRRSTNGTSIGLTVPVSR